MGGPPGTAYTTSGKGWMEGPLYLDWFKNVFLKHSEDVKDKTRVLVFDGYASHLTLELLVVLLARANNVVLLCQIT